MDSVLSRFTAAPCSAPITSPTIIRFRVDTNSFLISKKNQNRTLPELSCISGFGDGAFASSKSNASNSGSDNFQSCVSRDFAATVSEVQSPLDGITANLLQLDSAFPSEEDVQDIDCPSAGFASIEDALRDIRDGKFVVVVDDEDRENEGDLIMAGSMANPNALAFLTQHSTGIICVSMKGDDLDRLRLPLMVNDKDNEEALSTAFTVSVDGKFGVTTGVSASDRAATILALSSPDSKPDDFRRPGHIFPLRYREGGVLKRAGHTEAALDLAVMAGLPPVGILSEIVDARDGSMARLPWLRKFAAEHNLLIISIADLIRCL